MICRLNYFLLLSLLAWQVNCAAQAKNNRIDSLLDNQKQPLTTQAKKENPFEDNWTNEMTSYKEYTISLQYKNAGKTNRFSGILIKKGEQILASYFDEPESLLTEYRIGLFNLHDTHEKQLVIESTLPRSWRYRVFNLYPKFKLVFDSAKYNLGHEIFFLDIDKDGRKEILLNLMTFDYFGINYRKGWVTPQIIFEFDTDKQTYAFANHRYEEHLLKKSNEKLAKIKQVKENKSKDNFYDSNIYSAVMNLFLTYVYLGKESDGWKLFENYYDSSDKDELKREIKKHLAKDTLYQLMQIKKN